MSVTPAVLVKPEPVFSTEEVKTLVCAQDYVEDSEEEEEVW